MKYYHYIIENIKTGERSEIIVKNKRPLPRAGYKYIACCGYHDEPRNAENKKTGEKTK